MAKMPWDKLESDANFAVAFLAALAVSLVVAAVRICGVTHPAFQAVAHLFLGLLIGVGICRNNPAWLIPIVGLCVVEVPMAIITRI